MIDPNHLILDLDIDLDCVMITLDLVMTDRLRTMMEMIAEILIMAAVMVEQIDEIPDDGDTILLQETMVTTLPIMIVHLTEIILAIEGETLKNFESNCKSSTEQDPGSHGGLFFRTVVLIISGPGVINLHF